MISLKTTDISSSLAVSIICWMNREPCCMQVIPHEVNIESAKIEKVA